LSFEEDFCGGKNKNQWFMIAEDLFLYYYYCLLLLFWAKIIISLANNVTWMSFIFLSLSL